MKKQKLYSVTISLADVSILNTMDITFFVYPTQWFNMLHNHKTCEIFFLAAGECVFNLEDEEYRFCQNDVFAVSPSVFHKICQVRDNTELYAIKVILSPNKNNKADGQNVYDTLSSFMLSDCGISYLHNCEDLILLVKKIRSELFQRQPNFREKIYAYFTVFYVDFVRHIRNQASETSPMIDKSINIEEIELDPESRNESDEVILDYYFYRHYMLDSSITDLAKSLGMSVSNAHRLVKQTYGMNFIQKLTKSRITAAKMMLCDRSIPLEKVAENVGYRSYTGFFSAFKKTMKITPSQYRDKNQV